MSVSRTIGTALLLSVFALALAAQPFGSRITGTGQAKSSDGNVCSLTVDLFTSLDGDSSALYGQVRFQQAGSGSVEILAKPSASGGFMTASGRVATFDGPAVMRVRGSAGATTVRRGELHLMLNDPCGPAAARDSLSLRFCPDDDCPPFSFDGAMIEGKIGVCRQGKTIP